MKITYDNLLRNTCYIINDIHEFPKILNNLTNSCVVKITHLHNYKIVVFKNKYQYVVYVDWHSIVCYASQKKMLRYFIVIYNLLLYYKKKIISIDDFINLYNDVIRNDRYK